MVICPTTNFSRPGESSDRRDEHLRGRPKSIENICVVKGNHVDMFVENTCAVERNPVDNSCAVESQYVDKPVNSWGESYSYERRQRKAYDEVP